jgi:hypothetical protein
MIKKNIFCTFLISLLILTGQNLFAQTNQNSASDQLKGKLIPPADFKHCEIGNPTIKGIVIPSENGYDIIAGGVDIWGEKDEFTFVYIERTGDFDIITQIASLTAANLYTKAGIMAREELTPGSRHIYFQVFPDNNSRNKNNGGYEFQYRQVRDSLMKAIYPKSSDGAPEFPVAFPNTWIRLKRVRNEFTGYYSTDGKSWKPYTTYSLKLSSKIYLGMAVTSHNPDKNTIAKFRDIKELIH